MLDKQPILLVLTFNSVVKKSADGLGQPRLTWLRYARSTNSYSFKKHKPLNTLQRIDCVRDSKDAEFSLITPDKAYAWRPSTPALRNTFIAWCVETARYSFSFAPPTNVDDRALSYLVSLFQFHYLHSQSAATQSTASHRLILSSLDKVVVEERKEVDETVVVPPLSASQTANILHFLDQSGLDVSRIHQLEAALSASMLVAEQAAIEALYDGRQVEKTQRIMQGIEDVSEKLDELQLWLSHHDAELNRMRAGIERIEGKNTRLEVQEYNHQLLYSTLKDIITKLTLPPDVVRTLEQPDFRGHMQGVMRAAQQLDAVLTLQLDPALEEMSSVKEQRAKYAVLKQQFANQVRVALENLFTQYAASSGAPATEVNGAVLENNAAQQAEIGKYVGLAQYLSRLDADAYMGLRPRYTAAFARQYEAKFRAFFADVKKLIQQEKHDSALLSFPDFPPGSRAPSMANAHVPPTSVFQTNTASSIRGRQSGSAAFRNAVSCIIPLITREEQFLFSFFTTAHSPSSTGPSPPGTPTGAAGGSEAAEERQSREDVRRMMAQLFPHVSEHLQELASIAYRMDPFYALEMEVAIDRLMQAGASADYLVNVMTLLQSHLKMLFNKFIDEQIAVVSAISASPKKSGVLPPVLRFPSFIVKCESVVRGSGSSAADTSYQKLSFALFRWLEAVAATDEKYTDVFLIENFYYFHTTFSAAFAQPIPALSVAVEKAAASYAARLQRYITWQVEYEMKEIARFWTRLEEAQKQMAPEEVQHSRDLGKHDLRAITRDKLTLKNVTRSVTEVYKRVRKHLPKNDGMARIVWGKVGEYLVERMRWFEQSVQQSYKEEKLQVTSADVQDIINKITASPPKVSDRD